MPTSDNTSVRVLRFPVRAIVEHPVTRWERVHRWLSRRVSTWRTDALRRARQPWTVRSEW